MKKITSKQAQKFLDEAELLLVYYGYKFVEKAHYTGTVTYEKTTEFGKHVVHIWNCTNSLVYTICTRFENAEMASKRFTNCDSYNGKCNFHYPKIEVEEILNEFEITLANC